MPAPENKKLALLRILQILKDYSDSEHPLRQEDIAKKLYAEYGITVERKAISRNISLLKEAGYDVVSTKNGSYLCGRTFENSEIRMLIDGVLSGRYVTAKHSKDLIGKLCTLTNKYFVSHVKNVYSIDDWSKTENPSLFLNIEIVDEAISRNKQIVFDYNKYGADKKLHKSKTHRVSPYQLILHNQRYYLMANNEKWNNIGYFRLDHITDMQLCDEPLTPIRTLKGYESGIDYKDLATARPYMFSDKAVPVTFTTTPDMIDYVFDWFGNGCNFTQRGDEITVSVRVSPNAMKCWALQFSDVIEVISPVSLREEIKTSLAKSIKKYESDPN